MWQQEYRPTTPCTKQFSPAVERVSQTRGSAILVHHSINSHSRPTALSQIDLQDLIGSLTKGKLAYHPEREVIQADRRVRVKDKGPIDTKVSEHQALCTSYSALSYAFNSLLE